MNTNYDFADDNTQTIQYIVVVRQNRNNYFDYAIMLLFRATNKILPIENIGEN